MLLSLLTMPLPFGPFVGGCFCMWLMAGTLYHVLLAACRTEPCQGNIRGDLMVVGNIWAVSLLHACRMSASNDADFKSICAWVLCPSMLLTGIAWAITILNTCHTAKHHLQRLSSNAINQFSDHQTAQPLLSSSPKREQNAQMIIYGEVKAHARACRGSRS